MPSVKSNNLVILSCIILKSRLKKSIILLLLTLSVGNLWANPSIPDTISIGNVRVSIHPSAKPILEKEFAMLGANKKYVASLVDKMRLYFPVMEPILTNGNVPLDFKYLSVQESSLNPNAISTSNAVGYWQFKLETAKDVGLKVNDEVDERRHIMEATKGAVNYFNRNNGVLRNWVSTLLSYRVGLGTIKKLPYSTNWADKSVIEVDSSTDWYVLRFLAYKEFWSDKMATLPSTNDSTNLVTYQVTKGKNLYELSDELKVSYDELKRYNTWVLKDWIPEDKGYTLYHPSNIKPFESINLKIEEPILTASVDSTKLYTPSKSVKTKNKEILSDQFEVRNHTVIAGESLSGIAAKYDMKLGDLLRLNNLTLTSMVAIGQKIKVNRRIPMLEIISQKLEEKSKAETPKTVVPSQEPDIKVEEEEVRKITSNESEKSFYIAPAESREIIIKSETKAADPIIEPVQKTEISKETPAVVKQAPKPSEPVYYIHEVEPGDTLFKLARVYQVSVEDLIRWNNLGKNPAIRVGQKIKLKP
jgi:membrane-bound lytic murein transglycosylase D